MQLTIHEKTILIDAEDFALIDKHTWTISKSGYAFTTYGPKEWRSRIWMHNLIMGHRQGQHLIVDHIDRNPLNNQRDNLRLVTQADNIRNSVKWNTKNKYRGVHPARKNWATKVSYNKFQIRIYHSSVEEECAYAYNYFIQLLKIQHAYLNPVVLDEEVKKRIELNVIHRLKEKGIQF